MNENDIMTTEEVARLLKVSESAIHSWAKKGSILCEMSGSTWHFSRENVDKWIEENLSAQQKVAQERRLIESLLKPEAVAFTQLSSKNEVIEELADLICRTHNELDREKLIEGVLHREELMSTGIGLGIGVPHVRLGSIKNVIMTATFCQHGLEDYVSIDGQPVHFVFMIVAGQYQHTEHIKLLSAISKVLKNEVIREKLLASSSPEEFYSILTHK